MNSIEICINELGYAVVPISGTSMLPLLKEGKALVQVETDRKEELKKGDVVLYKKNDGTLVLHRIIKVKSKDFFVVLGDNQVHNAETISREQVVAKACGFFINGRYVDDNTLWYRLYKRVWNQSLLVRRICLAPNIFKRNSREGETI